MLFFVADIFGKLKSGGLTKLRFYRVYAPALWRGHQLDPSEVSGFQKASENKQKTKVWREERWNLLKLESILTNSGQNKNVLNSKHLLQLLSPWSKVEERSLSRWLITVSIRAQKQILAFRKTQRLFLSPLFSHSFRCFSLSVKDIWQYYLNLTEANEKQRSDWRLEYILTKAFGLTDLKPQSLLQLGLSLSLPQTKAFDQYFSHFMVNYNNSITCDGYCKVTQVCSVLYLDQSSYSKCVAKGEWSWVWTKNGRISSMGLSFLFQHQFLLFCVFECFVFEWLC